MTKNAKHIGYHILRHFCKAHKPTLQSQALQKSLNPSLLPAVVFQFGFTAKHQHRIIISTLATIIFSTKVIAQPNVPKPTFNSFGIVSTLNSNQNQSNNSPLLNNPFTGSQMPLGGTATDVLNQVNQNAMMQMGIVPTNNLYKQNQAQQLEEFKKEEAKEKHNNSLAHFQSYLTQLLHLNPNSFSITKAVYLSEAVFYDKPFTYEQFLKAIQQRASFVKQILKQEGISIKNGSAVNYAIQKLFSQNCIINQSNNKQIVIKKIEYDFEDFNGDNDYTKMFVSKVLQTNSGQCHSMPLLYLCIAEQLNTKAWLSLAPQHSFIKFYDAKNKLSNFEATNGHIVSLNWLLQSNAISSLALKNKTYLDTLSSKKLFAQCLADFQMAYLVKNGYDDFTNKLNEKILLIDSNNINAIMYNNNIATIKFQYLQKQFNYHSKEQIQNIPILLQALNEVQIAQQNVNNLGYQEMPKEQYLQWLKSIENEKAKRIKASATVKPSIKISN
jgi:hypothetical protein